MPEEGVIQLEALWDATPPCQRATTLSKPWIHPSVVGGLAEATDAPPGRASDLPGPCPPPPTRPSGLLLVADAVRLHREEHGRRREAGGGDKSAAEGSGE